MDRTNWPWRFFAGQEVNEREREKLNQLVTSVEQELSCKATITEIAQAFELLSAGMKYSGSGEALGASQAYLIALNGFSSMTIREMVKKVLTGQIESLSKTFMPTAPELSAHCRSTEAHLLAQCSSIQKIISTSKESHRVSYM